MIPQWKPQAWRYLDLAKSVKYLKGDKDIFNFGEHLGMYTQPDGSLDLDKAPRCVGVGWRFLHQSRAEGDLR